MIKLKLRPGRLPPSLPLTHPAALIATGLGVGLAPMASGTWGSLVTLPFGWFIAVYGGTIGLVAATAVVTALGIWAGEIIARHGSARDPGFIVIDEIAGMLLTLVFAPLTWWGFALAFLLFRAADIFKPFPANWCDRNLHGGLGVMADDLVAALYAGVATFLLSEYVIRESVLPRLGLAG
jgi:phosphatidylglycerophosphatase A